MLARFWAFILFAGLILTCGLVRAQDEATLKKRALQALRQREWNYIQHEEAQIRAEEQRLNGIPAHKRKSAKAKEAAEAARNAYIQKRLEKAQSPEETEAYKEYLAKMERDKAEREEAREKYARIRETLRNVIENDRVIPEKVILELE